MSKSKSGRARRKRTRDKVKRPSFSRRKQQTDEEYRGYASAVVTIASLVLSGVWFMLDPGFEPVLAFFASVVVFIQYSAFKRKRFDIAAAMLVGAVTIFVVGMILYQDDEHFTKLPIALQPSLTPTNTPIPTAVPTEPPPPTDTPTNTPTPTPTPTNTPTSTPTPCAVIQQEGWISYVVKAGDTYRSLEDRTTLDVLKIQEINCFYGELVVGQILWFPYIATPTPTAIIVTPKPSRTVEPTPTLTPTPTLVLVTLSPKETISALTPTPSMNLTVFPSPTPIPTAVPESANP